MNDDIEAEAIELATAQSPLTNMQVAELLAEIERLREALQTIAENENGDYYDGDAAFARAALEAKP